MSIMAGYIRDAAAFLSVCGVGFKSNTSMSYKMLSTMAFLDMDPNLLGVEVVHRKTSIIDWKSPALLKLFCLQPSLSSEPWMKDQTKLHCDRFV